MMTMKVTLIGDVEERFYQSHVGVFPNHYLEAWLTTAGIAGHVETPYLVDGVGGHDRHPIVLQQMTEGGLQTEA